MNCMAHQFSAARRETIITEHHLHLIWQRRLFRQEELIAEDGRKIKIAFPGMLNLEKGPDFLNARIYIDGKLYIGDLELHIFTGDWYVHRHSDNMNYSNVILHIALWRNNENTCVDNIPQLVLEPYIEQSITELLTKVSSSTVFTNGYSQTSSLDYLLEEAGDRRFQQKVSRYEKLLLLLPPDEVLYRGIMEALGYKNNKAQFYELAKRLPYSYLKDVTRGYLADMRKEKIEKMLLFCAGFIDYNPMQNIIPKMDTRYWRVNSSRPANNPIRRIEGISGFLAGSIIEDEIIGFFYSRLHSVRAEDVDTAESARRICRDIVYDFAVQNGIGEERGLLIIFNVALPFLYAYCKDIKMRSLISVLYSKHRRLSDNIITKRVMGILSYSSGDMRIADNVRQQMGLIQLYKEWF